MNRRYNQLLLAGLVGGDALLIAGAWWGAYLLRFVILEGLPGLVPPTPFPTTTPYYYVVAFPFVVIGGLLAHALAGLYVPRRVGDLVQEFLDVLKAQALLLAGLLVVQFIAYRRVYHYSRAVVALFLVLSVLLVFGERLLLRLWLRRLRERGQNLRSALVVGAGPIGSALLERIRENPWTGIRVDGILSDDPALAGGAFEGIPVLGGTGEIASALERVRPQQVFIALPFAEHAKVRNVLEALADSLVEIHLVPDTFESVALRAQAQTFDGLPILSLRESPLRGAGRLVKRVFDVLLSALGLLVLSPLLAAIALLVRRTSPGPVLYGQERMGLDGRTFRMWKFRTMPAGVEEDTGPVWGEHDDRRATPLGRWLRRRSLDELPQLWNVLRGDMSLVGPRPERPVFIEEFRKRIPRYMLRHKARSGITGWAQVNGWRGNTSLEKRIEYDLFYIENWTLGLDFKILLLTLFRGWRSAPPPPSRG